MTAKKATKKNVDKRVAESVSKKSSKKAVGESGKSTTSRKRPIYENLLAPERQSSSPPLSLFFTEILKWDPEKYLLDTERVKRELGQSEREILKTEPDEANRLVGLLARLATRPPEEKLKWFHAAMLCRFIEEHERGEGIHPSVLDFLYNVFMDVLQGLPFDMAICLPGREISREWTGVSRSQREKQEAALFVKETLRFGEDEELRHLFPHEPPEAIATLAAARLWSKSASWVRNARTEYDPRESTSKQRPMEKPLKKNSRKTKKSGMTSQSA
jgi:hypothetical protein